jgi:hypothetical protein
MLNGAAAEKERFISYMCTCSYLFMAEATVKVKIFMQDRSLLGVKIFYMGLLTAIHVNGYP